MHAQTHVPFFVFLSYHTVTALDAHPRLPLFAVGTAAGTLTIWDADERAVAASRAFKHSIQCVKFSVGGAATALVTFHCLLFCVLLLRWCDCSRDVSLSSLLRVAP
jgi:hypothetical protein